MSGIGLAVLSLPGCRRTSGLSETLTIATTWPEPERKELAAAFRRWLAERPEPVATVRIDWVVLDPGSNLSQVRPQRSDQPLQPVAPAIMLGGPTPDYQRLATQGRLAPVEEGESPPWRIVRRTRIGWALPPGKAGAPGARLNQPQRPDGFATFDDPRRDPLSLAWAKGELGAGSWAEGYARLVRDASGPRRIGRLAGAALAAVERGEAAAAPTADVPSRLHSVVFAPAPHAVEWTEGVAVLADHARNRPARLFVQFLEESGRAERPDTLAAAGPAADALLADLLGATLVDAQDELWAAWASLNRAGGPALATMWLTQAPPWPPASIEKLESEPTGVQLVQTLAEQIVPDAEVRAWLLRSWLGAKRVVDGPLLAELAAAGDGRLVQEPRFRAWLCAEWTAWARQRYRRVSRSVEGLRP